jgi:hypothetical protein
MTTATLAPEGFNAIIEGTEQDEWRLFYFKLAHVEVQERVARINDRVYRYELHGKTKDYSHIENAESQPGLEAKVDFLGFCPGVVLRSSPVQVLGRPRTVCMRDGRIFIDEHMKEDSQYVEALVKSLEDMGKMFNDKRTDEWYRKTIRSCPVI